VTTCPKDLTLNLLKITLPKFLCDVSYMISSTEFDSCSFRGLSVSFILVFYVALPSYTLGCG